MFRRRALAPALLATSSLALAGCGAGTGPDGAGVQVLASIYPLAYVASEVGGDLVTVSTATPAGTDPHSVELSPRQLRDVGDADLVVYLGGFQAAVDEAVAERTPEHAVDVAPLADRVARGGAQLARLVATSERRPPADPLALTESFEDLLRGQ